MSVWHSDVEREAWMEKNCRTCFQPAEAAKRIQGIGPGCPHLLTAEKNKYALPEPWTRKRNAIIGETFTCKAYTDKPPVNRRGTAPADTAPMFDDLPEADRNLVPVEGWPDYKALQRKQKEGEHQ